MTIRAVLRNGQIQPLEPFPPDWADGQELVVEEPYLSQAEELSHLDDWTNDLEAAAAQVPLEEHRRFCDALTDIEQESKDAVRREWGLP